MRLPGATYDRGPSSLGREAVYGPLSVADAQANAASAKGAIVNSFNQLHGIASAWAESEDRANATKSFADYKTSMSQLQTSLAGTPVLRPQDIPSGVDYRKDEPQADGSMKERETIPTWEVAPAIYDQANKQAQTLAIQGAGSRNSRAWLETNLQEASTMGAAQISALHFTGRKAALHGTFETAIQQFVNAGAPKDAIQAVDQAEAAGAMTPTEAAKRRQKVGNDAANMAVNKLIIQETDAAKLEAIGDQVLNNKGLLTDEQASSLSKSALAKAQRIRLEVEKKDKKDRERTSSRLLTDYVLRIRLDKDMPPKAEIIGAVNRMEPADGRQLLTLVDRKDGSESTDKATETSLTNMLIGLINAPVGGKSLEERVFDYRAAVDNAYKAGKLENKVWRQLHEDGKSTLDRFTIEDPLFKEAQATVYANIARAPKTAIFSSTGDNFRFVVAQEMETALLRAKLADPKLNALQWVTGNMSTYQEKADGGIATKLRDARLGGYLRYNANGGLDSDGTLRAIENDFNGKKITREQLRRGTDILNPGTIVRPNPIDERQR